LRIRIGSRWQGDLGKQREHRSKGDEGDEGDKGDKK
jgi:hypothetical protein